MYVCGQNDRHQACILNLQPQTLYEKKNAINCAHILFWVTQSNWVNHSFGKNFSSTHIINFYCKY